MGGENIDKGNIIFSRVVECFEINTWSTFIIPHDTDYQVAKY